MSDDGLERLLVWGYVVTARMWLKRVSAHQSVLTVQQQQALTTTRAALALLGTAMRPSLAKDLADAELSRPDGVAR